MEEPVEQFRHEPLNLNTNSLRLIEVLPTASRFFETDDSIQCNIRHATTDEKYVCLSYVWGPDDRNRIITINGKSFEVRRNLWDFLRSASKRPRAKTTEESNEQNEMELDFRSLWIDALCIDQQNLRERNHQVQQMGSIYRNAQYIVSWMGHDYRVASFLYGTEATSGFAYFCANPYWTRAWITQEALLARDIYFLAALKAVDIHVIIQRQPYLARINRSAISNSGSCRYPVLYELGEDLNQTFGFYVQYDTTERSDQSSLLANMWRFRDKKCSNWQDVVYSLLSISTDVANFEVKYDVSKACLALDVMRMYKGNFCSCVAGRVYQALKVCDSDLQQIRDDTFAELLIPTFQVQDDDQFSCSRCNHRVTNLHRVDRGGNSSKMIRICCLSCTHLRIRSFKMGSVIGELAQGHLVFEPENYLGHVKDQTELRWKPTWNGNLIQLKRQLFSEFNPRPHHGRLTLLDLDAGVSGSKIDKDGNAVLRFSTIGLYELISVCQGVDRAGFENHRRVQLERKIQADDPVWKLLI